VLHHPGSLSPSAVVQFQGKSTQLGVKINADSENRIFGQYLTISWKCYKVG